MDPWIHGSVAGAAAGAAASAAVCIHYVGKSQKPPSNNLVSRWQKYFKIRLLVGRTVCCTKWCATTEVTASQVADHCRQSRQQ